MKTLLLAIVIISLLGISVYAEESVKNTQLDEFIDMLNVNWYFKGYDTSYKDWTPLLAKTDGEPVVYYDSNLFLMAYTRELEKKYNVKIDCNNMALKEINEYLAKRAEKDGHDILVTTVIEDFYFERGLLRK